MSKSYGFIEITGVVAAMDALDIMCKTADVELASWERKLGGRLVTIIVQGDVAAVTEAVEAAATNAIKKPASYAVIANPHEEIVKMVESNCSSPLFAAFSSCVSSFKAATTASVSTL